jgi:hypothetical protein
MLSLLDKAEEPFPQQILVVVNLRRLAEFAEYHPFSHRPLQPPQPHPLAAQQSTPVQLLSQLPPLLTG